MPKISSPGAADGGAVGGSATGRCREVLAPRARSLTFQLFVAFFGTRGFQGFLPGQSYSLSAEQIVDNPVPRGCGDHGGLRCFLPGHSFSPTVEQTVDIPVPLSSCFGGLQGLHPGQSSTAFPDKIVDFPVPRGDPEDFHPDPGSAALSSEPSKEAFQGFFLHFSPAEKSAQVAPHPGSQLGADFASSTPPAHSDQFWEEEAGGRWMRLPSGRWYLLSSEAAVYWDDPG